MLDLCLKFYFRNLLKLLIGNVFLPLICIFTLICGNAYGLEVFSDYAIYNMNSRSVNFERNVRVVLEGATLLANNLDVDLFEDEMAIKSAIAYGNLRIYNKLESATASRAVYSSGANLLRLEGNVVIVKDGAEVRADQYNFNLADRSSILNSNSSSRVRVRIDNTK